MRPFNLQELLDNPSIKVVTRDGRPVKILCTDANDEYPIVCLIPSHGGDVKENYTENGRYYRSNEESAFDIFFDSVKKEGWVNIYKMPDTDGFEASCIFKTKEEARIFRGANYVATTKITWEEDL